MSLSRRGFLGLGCATLMTGRSVSGGWSVPPSLGDAGALDHFPRQDPALVREMVTVAHGNLARVTELLRASPALADASYDWGFGDWETALGAAAHTGRVGIAQLLIEHGASPTVFSAAMLGQLDLVKALVGASPGVVRSLGPHSIPLINHAKAGGEPARSVVAYLTELGGGDGSPALSPLTEAEFSGFVGVYAFGAGADERIEVVVERQALAVRRLGGSARRINHLGDGVFFPAGAEAVRIKFAPAVGKRETIEVHDPGLIVAARRAAQDRTP